MDDVLKRGQYVCALENENMDWFVDEIIGLENKTAFYSKNTGKYFVITQEDEEVYKKKNICRYCEK